jgi:hypothetical protein
VWAFVNNPANVDPTAHDVTQRAVHSLCGYSTQ